MSDLVGNPKTGFLRTRLNKQHIEPKQNYHLGTVSNKVLGGGGGGIDFTVQNKPLNEFPQVSYSVRMLFNWSYDILND